MSARRLPTAFNLLCLWLYVTRVLSEFGVYWPAALQPHAGDSDVEAISGACMLLRRSTYDRLGPMDEVLPMGAEDLEYCARVTGAGGRIVCVHDAVVIHVLGASMDQIAEESHFRAYKVPLFFLRLHRGRAYTNRLRWLFCLGMAFRAVVNAAAAVVTGKRGLWRARAYLRLVHWGLTDYDLEPAAPPGARSA
jgi:GT2 family glycosyltransferase